MSIRHAPLSANFRVDAAFNRELQSSHCLTVVLAFGGILNKKEKKQRRICIISMISLT